MNHAIELPGKVLVIAKGETVSGLRELSKTLTLHESGLDEMPPQIAVENADIIVAEVDPQHEGSIQRLDAISSARPNVPIIAGVDSLDIRTTRALLKRGVTDLLGIPFSIEELLDALADIDLSGLPSKSAEVELAPVVTFIGCAGGVGTTTLATHFAGAMLQNGERSTVLDLDVQKGDVAEYLGMNNRLSLQDIIEADKRLDSELLGSVLTSRGGMPDVLAAPQDILPLEDFRFEQLQPVIEALRASTDMVVIDMPKELTNWGLSTLFASDRIVIVGGLSVHMLRKMRRQIDFLISMGVEREAIKVVVNRVSTGLFKTIRSSEAEEALRHKIAAVIPEDSSVIQEAQDHGEFVWGVSSRGKFEKAVRAFADELILDLESEA
ncbi:CpaE family protein [Erythrobacter sp. GH1-10]|uniref:CpaE family protein n=1 Tax=Erythrobacter sp. GH1-10 TaxID=3349334 RepID=UPI003877DD3D